MQKEISWLLKEKYNNKPTKQFYRDIERLNAGEPLDYVMGFTEFLGCKIDLSKKPLIPRPETEFWVEEAIKEMSCVFDGRQKPRTRVLDIFCGSGCIGIAVLKHIKNVEVFFSDIENRMAGRKVIKSDVFSSIKGKFDYIFANPPYVAVKRKNKAQKSVLKYEPEKALFGGKDGLFYIKKFLALARNFLNPGGRAFMEFSPEQKNKIEKLLAKYGYKSWKFHKDQFGRWRWLSIC